MRVLLSAPLLALALALGLGACATAPSLAPSADAVIAAERAFAADAAARGWAAAFRSHAAADAMTLSPGPVNAHEALARIDGDGETTLDWRPAYAGIARSGDFGFTTGPFLFRGRDGVAGHYFTVWRLEPDGTWKWIFDAGTSVRDLGPPVGANEDIPTLPLGRDRPLSAAAAIAAVAALEAEHDRASELAALLAGDARVNRPGEPVAFSREASRALMAADGGARFHALRREASSYGDMVFSMGEVRDMHQGAERVRYYARIWQRRRDGWRVVFDEIVPVREAP